MCRIGLEAGPLSHWLHAGFITAGRDAVLLDATREGRTFGDDCEDRQERCVRDRPVAALGWYRPVHAKSMGSQDTHAVLVGRKLLQGKLLDVELGIRGYFAAKCRRIRGASKPADRLGKNFS